MEKINSSSRLLTEIEFLNKKSDEKNPVVIKEMLDYLHLKGFKTQRCTLLGDLNLLERFNMGITHKTRKYYYQKSAFSIEELMLISDAICYSNYIDLDNSKRLIDKIKTLLAGSSAEKLERQANVSVKPKSMNSLCIGNAGKIHQAIMADRKISFGYLHCNKDKKLVPRENFFKVVSPYKLVWDNSQYYLIGIDSEKGKFLVNFRVDKLFDLKITDEKRERIKSESEFYDPVSKDIDIEKYLKSVFFMFGSRKNKLTRIQMQVHESVVGAFVDKFGIGMLVYKQVENTVEILVDVQVSSTFFGWVFQFGNLVKILTPNVQRQYLEHLNKVMEIYAEQP